ncbi:MAG: YdeI/OmpD-associated family protein [Bacteroidota bacterium]
MQAPKDVDSYLQQAPAHWRPILESMREILLTTDLEESIKWMFPVYSYGKKNVVGIIHTKGYVGAWFVQGALLTDPNNRLINAKEDQTIAQRQLRFTSPETVDLELFRGFLEEAIMNQRAGLELKPQPREEIVIPPELQAVFANRTEVVEAYQAFTPYKQREFCTYISGAKRADTKAKRLAKIIPMILAGEGLSDRYRK